MRKNKTMRLAALLLVLTLITSCFVGGTFAKYITEVTSDNEEARVAAWGFGTNNTIAFDLFSTSYGDTVISSENDVNVIAPGTEQDETIQLTYADTTGKGAPEVAYEVTLAVDAANTNIAESIKANTAITWKFNGDTYGTWDAMIEAINGYKEEVDANNLPTIVEDGLTIGWKWEFAKAGNDATDTQMGDAATLATCKLGIKMTATQVD